MRDIRGIRGRYGTFGEGRRPIAYALGQFNKFRERLASVHKLRYPHGYTSKNSEPLQPICSFSTLQCGLKLLPAAYMEYIRLK
jgi:hypothetical protein